MIDLDGSSTAGSKAGSFRDHFSMVLAPFGPVMLVLFAAAGVSLVWQVGVDVLNVPEFLLPSPKKILTFIVESWRFLLENASITLLEAWLGFCLAVVAGFLLGVLFAVFQTFERMFLPYAIASQAVPIVAVAPLLILWLGSGIGSKIALAALLCFFPMLVNTTKGLRAVTEQHLALMSIYNATRWQVFCKLRFPASLPFIAAGMRISAALSMIGAIVAEYAGADKGLGYVIMQATYRLDTVQLFAALFFSAFGGLAMFGVVLGLEYVFLRRYEDKSNS